MSNKYDYRKSIYHTNSPPDTSAPSPKVDNVKLLREYIDKALTKLEIGDVESAWLLLDTAFRKTAEESYSYFDGNKK